MISKLFMATVLLAASPVFAASNTTSSVHKTKVETHSVAADNTEMNKVDRSDKTLTPPDQARGTDADVETTRKIREALNADDALSVDAKNIKIITLGGTVTLRGPVSSAAEVTRVEKTAKGLSGNRKVRSELNVAL